MRRIPADRNTVYFEKSDDGYRAFDYPDTPRYFQRPNTPLDVIVIASLILAVLVVGSIVTLLS